MAQKYAFSPHRKEPKLVHADLLFKVADFTGVRLYCVSFPIAKGPGIMGIWQNVGTGMSTRLAEHLLTQVDTLVELPFDVAGDGDVSVEKVPASTHLSETAAHQALRVWPCNGPLRKEMSISTPRAWQLFTRAHEAMMQQSYPGQHRLEEAAAAGRPVRLRRRHVDILSVVDMIISSLTKFFSGYADYLLRVYQETFRNEFFAGDAEKLLAHSADYLPRRTILNRNAAALAALCRAHATRLPRPQSALPLPFRHGGQLWRLQAARDG
ncbi:hypothetical protein K438DRAFT_2015978 [Mycena galopus ATCC 62051]|nr:hypothetical protein K438DRAFT_2015978 [Mycena galopus ATCC 62051]